MPNVADRIAQTAAAMLLEDKLEPIFHRDSYGYRPGRSALDALAVTRKRCWSQDWVVDLDIRAFFDSVPHDLLLKAVAHHTDERWVLLYIARWLTSPMRMPDGTLMAREKGTPQGSPISPLLANVFMHYAFDRWMAREHPGCPFERYADDVVVHCDTENQAQALRAAIATRLKTLCLELHPAKTKVAYCKDANRPGDAEHTSFDFLGYTFRARLAKGRRGYFASFSPAISGKARKAVGQKIRGWHLNRRSGTDLSSEPTWERLRTRLQVEVATQRPSVGYWRAPLGDASAGPAGGAGSGPPAGRREGDGHEQYDAGYQPEQPSSGQPARRRRVRSGQP